jgi:uncharacterized phage-associated protein
MHSALEIAAIVVSVCCTDGESDLTNMKLNKLLYFMQGTHLARTGRLLFADAIEAWQHGPVVPSVYHEYKCFKNETIVVEPESIAADESLLDSEEIETILDVLREYGKYTAGHLRDISHKDGSPWDRAYTGEAKRVIKTEDIRAYFTAECETPKFVVPLSRLNVIGHHDEEGHLVLPKEYYEENWE